MEKIDYNVACEGDLEAFLLGLEDQLASNIEAEFRIICPHPEWANIILDCVEADVRYQLPAGTEPFIDIYFEFPPQFVTEVPDVSIDPLETLEDLLRDLRDALDEEEGDEDND